jgi:hypothetical protein
MQLGKTIRISLGRKLLIEHCHFSNATQKGVIKRRIKVSGLTGALAKAAVEGRKPKLPLVFIKAFALASQSIPELRRSYVKLPWPNFYELEYSVGIMPITRDLDGEEIVMMAQFRDPESTPFLELETALQHMKTAPLRNVKSFDRALKIAAMPFPLRRFAFWLGLNLGRHRRKFFGTFAVSAMGLVEPVYTIHPLTSLLTYGVLDAAAAEIDIALSFDHRVYDGMTVVRAFEAIEAALNGPIAAELAGV